MVEMRARQKIKVVERDILKVTTSVGMRSSEERQARQINDFLDVGRSEETADERIICIHPDFAYDSNLRRVVVAGRRGETLTPTEDRLFRVFLSKPDKVFYKRQLKKEAFGDGYSDAIVRKNVERVRRKVEIDPSNPKVIVTLGHSGFALINNGKMQIVRIRGESQEEVRLPESPYIHRVFTYFPEKGVVIVNSEEVRLKKTLDFFLKALTSNPNYVIDYDTFIRILPWARDLDDIIRLEKDVNWHILRLRRIVEPNKRKGQYEYILSVPGKGYMLFDPDKPKAGSVLQYSMSQNVYNL